MSSPSPITNSEGKVTLRDLLAFSPEEMDAFRAERNENEQRVEAVADPAIQAAGLEREMRKLTLDREVSALAPRPTSGLRGPTLGDVPGITAESSEEKETTLRDILGVLPVGDESEDLDKSAEISSGNKPHSSDPFMTIADEGAAQDDSDVLSRSSALTVPRSGHSSVSPGVFSPSLEAQLEVQGLWTENEIANALFDMRFTADPQEDGALRNITRFAQSMVCRSEVQDPSILNDKELLKVAELVLRFPHLHNEQLVVAILDEANLRISETGKSFIPFALSQLRELVAAMKFTPARYSGIDSKEERARLGLKRVEEDRPVFIDPPEIEEDIALVSKAKNVLRLAYEDIKLAQKELPFIDRSKRPGKHLVRLSGVDERSYENAYWATVYGLESINSFLSKYRQHLEEHGYGPIPDLILQKLMLYKAKLEMLAKDVERAKTEAKGRR